MRSKIIQRILDQTPGDVDIFVNWYADLLVRINELIREKGISQTELSKKLNKQPSEISKWLSGGHNFTLRSLAKLSHELGEPLLEVPKRKVKEEIASEDLNNEWMVAQVEEQKIIHITRISKVTPTIIYNPVKQDKYAEC